jgi:hypothetical protein
VDVVAHFTLSEASPADEDEIRENFPTEVSVFTNGIEGVGEVLIRPVIHYAADASRARTMPGRVVFAFRE